MTDRVFGFALGATCLFWFVVPFLCGGSPRVILLVIAFAMLLIALVRPKMLAPLCRIWILLGNAIHAGISFVTLGVIYFLVITPGGVLLRACGRRRISASFDPHAVSYWQIREKKSTDFTRPY